MLLNKTRLLYHINKFIGTFHLCISPLITPDILKITYRSKDLWFSCWYKIVIYLLYITGLTKLFWTFIYYCLQYPALQIRRHLFYRFLQSIKPLLVLFFILTLDFILAFLLIKKRFNAIISIIYKFLKQVIFIENVDMESAEK